MTQRPLRGLPMPLTSLLADAVPALAAALDGSGPAVLPLPAGAEATRIATALRPEQPVEEESVAVVVATSGSTGEPKGVLLSADALQASAAATHARLGGAGSWLLALPPTRIAGLQVLVRSLLAGTQPVLLEPSAASDPAAFAAASRLLAGGRRYTALVPTQLRWLLDSGGPAMEALSSYDAVLLGGAAPPGRLVERACAAGVPVVTTYGMTETCGGCVYDGTPLDGVGWDIGQDGRVRLRGPVLARGYRLRPDLTAEVFVRGGFVTSDLGRRASDGRLVVLGRADDMVVSGGEKVAPLAVEAALEGHPSVADAAVSGRPDPEWGQRVVAYVVPRDPATPPTLAQLRDHVAAELPRTWAPRELHLLERLPLLPSGKLDRAALAAGDLRYGGEVLAAPEAAPGRPPS